MEGALHCSQSVPDIGGEGETFKGLEYGVLFVLEGVGFEGLDGFECKEGGSLQQN